MAHVNTIEVTEGPAIIHRQPQIGYTFKGVISSFKENGTTLDVSGDSFELVLEDADGADIHVLTIGSGIEFSGDGIEWRIEHTDTANFTKNAKWKYAIKWTRADNNDVIPVVAGTVTPRLYAAGD
jgi:hypothetical protein